MATSLMVNLSGPAAASLWPNTSPRSARPRPDWLNPRLPSPYPPSTRKSPQLLSPISSALVSIYGDCQVDPLAGPCGVTTQPPTWVREAVSTNPRKNATCRPLSRVGLRRATSYQRQQVYSNALNASSVGRSDSGAIVNAII